MPISWIVREALRFLEQEDQLRAMKTQKLRQDIQEGSHRRVEHPKFVGTILNLNFLVGVPHSFGLGS